MPGMCFNGFLVCGICGNIFGGFTEGGIPRDCEFCCHNRACEYYQKEKEPPEDRTSIRICPKCELYNILGR